MGTYDVNLKRYNENQSEYLTYKTTYEILREEIEITYIKEAQRFQLNDFSTDINSRGCWGHAEDSTPAGGTFPGMEKFFHSSLRRILFKPFQFPCH